MKKISILVLIAITSICFTVKAQKIKYLESISYEELDADNFHNHKNNIALSNYICKNGATISLGDTLVIGKPYNINNIQSENTLGVSGQVVNYHSHLYLGSIGAILIGTAMMGEASLEGNKAIITRLQMTRISKKNPYEVFVSIKKAGGGRFLGIKKVGSANLEKALDSREFLLLNAPLTRSEAIAKLKEAKDLLNLEMMTVEEYNTLKKELKPIIMKKS